MKNCNKVLLKHLPLCLQNTVEQRFQAFRDRVHVVEKKTFIKNMKTITINRHKTGHLR